MTSIETINAAAASEIRTDSKLMKKQTSEKVKDEDLSFFLLANITADTASLALVARGRAMNDIKKGGILVALEKLSTESTRGSAKTAARTVPRVNSITAFMVVHLGILTTSTASSLCSPKRSYSLFVCCHQCI